MEDLIFKDNAGNTLLSTELNRGIINIRDYRFSETQLQKLESWIKNYNDISELVTLTNYIPITLEEDEWKFFKYYTNRYDSYIRVSKILLQLKSFNFLQPSQEHSPLIHGDMMNGFIKITGRSVVSDAFEVYYFLLAWLEIYFKRRNPKSLRLEFWMEYFNTITSKVYFDMFKGLSEYQSYTSCSVNIYWYCSEDDEDMMELVEKYQQEFNLSFELVIVDDIYTHPMYKTGFS